MTDRAAARCSKCHQPVRKGDAVLLEDWCMAGAVVDGKRVLRPFLSVLLHLRCEPEWMQERKARKAPAPRAALEEGDG